MDKKSSSSLADGLMADFDGTRSGNAPGKKRGGGRLKQQIVAAVCVAVLLAAIFLLLRQTIGGTDSGDLSRKRTLIDAETNEVFQGYKIKEGTVYPWKNPKTGTLSLYPAERCYWTQVNGTWKAKLEPTYVLLNEMAGKSGATICPDCGREVVGHNPMPPIELLMEADEAEGGG